MKNNVNIINVVKFAGAYVAFVIGSGFATGQEILQFFTSNGIWSIGSILISMAMFSFFASVVIGSGYEYRDDDNFKPYQHFCGKYLGKIYDIITPICLFLILVVMVSGAGATLNEYYGLNVQMGSAIMVALVLVAFLFGLDNLINIVGLLGPAILAFAIAVGVVILFRNGANISDATAQIQNLNMTKTSDSWIVNGILYAAYNSALGVAFVSSIGKGASSKKEAMLGGVVGGVSLMAAVLVMNLALLSKVTDVYDLAIPTLYFAKSISPVLGAIFSVILLCGIFSTAAPMFWTVTDTFSNVLFKNDKFKTKIIAFLIAAVAFVGGVLPFETLVNVIYPYTGYLGIVLFICVIFKCIKTKKQEDTQDYKKAS